MNYKNINSEKVRHVQNLVSYNNEMRRALIDKLFFLDKVGDANVFVDYGCADGAVIKLASSIITNAVYIGYDCSPEMILLAKNGADNAMRFTSKLEDLIRTVKDIRADGNEVCLSIMSLIHEVYHYGPEKVKEFWDFVFKSDLFEYIALRDMCVSQTTSRPSDPISVAKVRMGYDKGMLAQWESNWGSLSENWSLTHFFLTYRYVESWDRELRENYLPLSLENLLALVPKGWKPTYLEHYTLPFIRLKVLEDFGVDLQDRTHLKLVLKKST